MRFGGIPFDWVERHAAGAVRRGASLDRLLSESMIDLRHGDRRDMISPTQHGLLSMVTVLNAGDSLHALARRPVNTNYPDIGLRLFLGCSTLEGAIQALARLYESAAIPIHFQLRVAHETATLSVHVDAGDEAEAAIIEEIYLVWMFMHLLRFLGRSPPIVDATVRDPMHFSLGTRHWGIGAPVSHGVCTALRFPRRLLAEPSAARAGDNPYWECHSAWFRFLEPRTGDGQAVDFVEDGNFVRLSDLAREVGVSTNTMRRRLGSAQGGFRQQRRIALVDAALTRLKTSDASTEDVAAELGYSDGRSFRRFLKAATGMTPQQVRDMPAMTNVNLQALEKLKVLGPVLSG